MFWKRPLATFTALSTGAVVEAQQQLSVGGDGMLRVTYSSEEVFLKSLTGAEWYRTMIISEICDFQQ